MRKFIILTEAWIVVLALLMLGRPDMAHGQDGPKAQTDKETRIEDKDFQAFVKAYVEVQRLRREYEPAINNAAPEQKAQVQKEANAKLDAVLAGQGLTVEKYNRIFAAVSRDETLKEKVLRQVREERGSS